MVNMLPLLHMELEGLLQSIVFEELVMLGARSMVRLGTAGAMIRGLNRGDFIIPTGAAHPGGSLRSYVPDGILPPVADIGLTSKTD